MLKHLKEGDIMYYVTAGCVATGEGTCEKHFRIYNF